MAVYTNDLRLKEIATGDESGTWGDSTNTNLELIAEAFSFGTEAITTNADTHTTTIADGSTDPGRSLFLKYTGTLDSACTITIGPNTVSKLWLIENATSGSQNIIIKQGSGSTITIPNGQTKAIYSDGAGSGGAMVDAFQDLSIPDLFVDDDLTIGDDLVFSSDSAVITFGADGDTTLTHTDGSGLTLNSTNKLMFNDASQFIQGSSATVLSLGATDEIDLTATAIDINGTLDVSGNATLGGTLGVTGAVTANAGVSIDNITIDGTEIDLSSGDLTIDVAGDIILDAGGAQLRFHDDGTDIGVISNESNNLIIKPQVSDADLIFKGNDGGSTITALTLDMSDAGAAIFNGHGTFNDTVTINSTSSGALTIAGTGGGINFTGGNNRVNFTSNRALEGATDGSTLTVGEDYTTIRLSGAVVANESGADADFRVESDGNANMLFVDAGNDRVGIGMSPSTDLHIKGVTSFDGDGSSRTEITSATASSIVSLNIGGIDATPSLARDVRFFTNAASSGKTERMRIDSSGNLLVGKAATTFSTEGIVAFSSADSNGSRVNITNDGGESLNLNRTTSDGKISIFYKDGSEVGSIASNSTRFTIDAPDNPLRVVSGTSNIQINHDTHVTVDTAGAERVRVNTSEMVINEDSNDYDFRVESDNNANMLLVDAGNDFVGIGNTTQWGGVLNVTSSDNGNTLVLACTDTDASAGPLLSLYRSSSSSAADGDILGQINFQGLNDANQAVTYGRMQTFIRDASDGTEDGTVQINHIIAGSEVNALELDNDEYVFNNGSNDVDFRVESNNNANMLVVDAGNDRVGIGATPINSALYVGKGGGFAGQLLVEGNASGGSYVGIGHGTDDAAIHFKTGALRFATSTDTDLSGFTELMRLSSSEMVVNEVSNNYDFRVESDGNTHALFVDANSNVCLFGKSTDALTTTGATISAVGTATFAFNLTSENESFILNNNNATGATFKMDFRQNNSSKGSIAVGSSSTAFNTSSDYRLKENIETLKDGLTRLAQLKPVQFTWTTDGALSEGFIAHEVDEVFPDAVTGEKDAVDEEGNIAAQQMDYGRITPLLVKAIQEQQEQIEELKAEIAKFKGE